MDIKLPTGAVDPGGGEPAIQRTNPGAANERLRKTGCAADARYKKAACRGEGGTQVRLLVKYSIDCQSAERGTEAVFGLAGKTRMAQKRGREARPRTPTPEEKTRISGVRNSGSQSGERETRKPQWLLPLPGKSQPRKAQRAPLDPKSHEPPRRSPGSVKTHSQTLPLRSNAP